MTLLCDIESAPLSVLLDIRHPAAYLALGPAASLADELGMQFNWLPLVAPPLNPPSEPAPHDDRGIRHRRYRAQAIARDIEVYAAAQNLVLRDYYRDPDPEALNLAWLWLRERDPEQLLDFLAEAFRAYWALELDPSDRGAVATMLQRFSPDSGEFLTWCDDDGPATAAQVALELRERGLFGVPGYLIDDEFFLGRQHLPMIRWILGGRKGPGPI
jgi:2-hydroxychromene-2-carboxylate isomerase